MPAMACCDKVSGKTDIEPRLDQNDLVIISGIRGRKKRQAYRSKAKVILVGINRRKASGTLK